MKNYIGFVNDHSYSMGTLKRSAIADYNTNITSVRDAANAEMMDTVVSVVGFGFVSSPVQRQVVISNPHVLRPITKWESQGNTPMYDGIGEMIELFESLPDAKDQNVSFLIMVTTDGDENASRRYNAALLKNKISKLQMDGRWTFVFRVPKGHSRYIEHLGISRDNIQEWETTSEGMAKSTVVNTQAMSNYFTSRSAGAKSSNTFYADASKVNTSALQDVTDKVSLYKVEQHHMPANGRLEIQDFILKFRMNYLKGAAFYQLVKTEAKVGHKKQILVRDRNTYRIYAGASARQMLGLPSDRNARLHPGNHKNYDIFIQSESTNRLLPSGSGVVYWEEIGVPFTQAELDMYSGKKQGESKGVDLTYVAPTNTPTPSPIPVQHKQKALEVNGAKVYCFSTREEARENARKYGKSPQDRKYHPAAQHLPERWFVFA